MMKTAHISVLSFLLHTLCTLVISESVKENNNGLYHKIIGLNQGSCPPERNYNKHEHEICHKFCYTDSDCLGGDKCCPDNCHSMCKPSPREKEGLCPSFESTLTSDGICDDVCTTDAECPGTYKCCVKGCRKTCVPTLADMGKPDLESPASKGFCPQEEPFSCVFDERKFCDENSCPNGYKCCPELCRWQCRKPLKERAGECPKQCPSETENKTCSSDYDCSPLFKCCKSCGNKCVKAVNVPTSIHNNTSKFYINEGGK